MASTQLKKEYVPVRAYILSWQSLILGLKILLFKTSTSQRVYLTTGTRVRILIDYSNQSPRIPCPGPLARGVSNSFLNLDFCVIIYNIMQEFNGWVEGIISCFCRMSVSWPRQIRTRIGRKEALRAVPSSSRAISRFFTLPESQLSSYDTAQDFNTPECDFTLSCGILSNSQVFRLSLGLPKSSISFLRGNFVMFYLLGADLL